MKKLCTLSLLTASALLSAQNTFRYEVEILSNDVLATARKRYTEQEVVRPAPN